jgi:curved DNA-binding protein CbpA
MEGTLYDLLGLPETASREQLKKRWRALAFELHPDRLQAASEQERRSVETRFSLLSRAWETLGDPDRRATYDARLRAHRERKDRAAGAAVEMERRRREALERQAARRRQQRTARVHHVRPVAAPKSQASFRLWWLAAPASLVLGMLLQASSLGYANSPSPPIRYNRAGAFAASIGTPWLAPDELKRRIQSGQAPFVAPLDIGPGLCITYSDGSRDCPDSRTILTAGAGPPLASKRSAAAR